LSHSSEPVSLRAVGSPEVKQKDYRTIPKTWVQQPDTDLRKSSIWICAVNWPTSDLSVPPRKCWHTAFNKKFWQEPIAYFPMILYGPHRKWRVQLFSEPLPGNDRYVYGHKGSTISAFRNWGDTHAQTARRLRKHLFIFNKTRQVAKKVRMTFFCILICVIRFAKTLHSEWSSVTTTW
jgi:hypothetical protein